MLVDLQGPESDYPGNASIEFGSLDSDRNPESTAYAHVTNTSGDYKADLTVTDISLYSGSGITVDSDATIAFSGTISTSKNGEMGMIPLYGTRTVTVDDEQVDYDYYYTFLNDGLRINIMEEGASSDSAYSKDQTYKILDYTGAGSLANEYYQNCISNWVELLENGYKLTQYNSDLYINLGDQRTLYVNTAWDGAEHGDIVVLDGKNLVYGYNAFSTVDAAFNNAADRTREIILASDASFTSDGPVALKNNITVSSCGEGEYSIDWSWTSDANGYFKSNKETAERTVTFASSVIVKEADASKMFGFYDNGNVTLKGEANLNGVKLSGADMQIAETGALNLDKDAKVYLSDGANLTVTGNVSDISSTSAASQMTNGTINSDDDSKVTVKFTKAFVDLEKIGVAGSTDFAKEITFDGAIGKV